MSNDFKIPVAARVMIAVAIIAQIAAFLDLFPTIAGQWVRLISGVLLFIGCIWMLVDRQAQKKRH